VQAIVLGTAQWGNPYGVTNGQGRLTDADLAGIVDTAKAAGIRAVDTAGAYGDAESRLSPWAMDFAITTKVRGSDPGSIAEQFDASLQALGVPSVHACLLHDWPTLTDGEATEAVRQLRALQDDDRVSAVGVSAYDDDELARALAVFGRIGVIQVPVNVPDQRLTRSPALAAIADQGAQIQARSVFLQGLLAGRSATPLGAHPDVLRFHDRCDEAGRGPIEGSLAFVRAQEWVTDVVVGVTSAAELRQIADAWESADGDSAIAGQGSHDLALIDPRRWA
jgi:aryl-alcohol dehydrogenase-like predicted oxidoreductase